MRIRPFALERWFARFEFSVPHLLSSSDCDGLAQSELLSLADEETAALWRDLKLGYTESQGLPLLRREIAGLYEGLSPEDVLVLVPEEGIFLAAHALLKPGDHVVCVFPGYQSLYEVARSIGCELSFWKPREEGWRFDVDELLALLTPRTRLVVANFPHNPTGALPSRAEFERLIRELDGRGIRLFSDEMYRFLELDPRDRLPSACELHAGAVSLFGMSKTFGLAGLRLGWLVSRDRALIRDILALKDYTTICPPAPCEILALIGLRARETLIARHRMRLAANLELLDRFFSRRAEQFSWVRPRGGTVGFPGFRRPVDVEAFCEAAAREAGVMVLPSSVYEHPRPHFRVGFGREAFPRALERFEAFLNKKSA